MQNLDIINKITKANINIDYINNLLKQGYTIKQIKQILKENYNINNIKFEIIKDGYMYNHSLKKYVKYESDNNIIINNHNNIFGALNDSEEVEAIKYVIDNIDDLKIIL